MNERLIKTLKESLTRFAETKPVMKGYYYNNVFDFIEQEGCFFESKAISTDESKFILKRMRSINQEFPKSQCYRNSFKMLLSDSDSRIGYVEGVICTKENPIITQHAWNEIKGKVVDVTLQKFGEFTDITYYGVRMPTDIVRRHILRNNFSGMINADDADNPWPLLKEKFHPDIL